MREPLKDRVRLEHILQAADNVLRYTDGKTYDDLQNEDMMCYAVVYNIMTIGEAAYHLTKAFQRTHKEIDWDVITKMRNVLAHDYYKLKLNIVWDVVQNDIPKLRQQVALYLSETNWSEWEKNEIVIKETSVHKSLVQTALRMKSRNYDVDEICKITGLSREEIENL